METVVNAPVQPATVAEGLRVLTRQRIGPQLILASRLGVSKTMVSKILCGREKWTPRLINRVLDACQATPEEIVAFNTWAAREAGWRL